MSDVLRGYYDQSYFPGMGSTPTPPVPATGATAGSPGTFTPAGATPPANLAAMTGITASPTTAWTTGQWVDLADGTDAYWNATAWTAGQAPLVEGTGVSQQPAKGGTAKRVAKKAGDP